MLDSFLDRLGRRRGPCREGHAWTEMADPVACERCGRIRERIEEPVLG